MRLFAGIPVPEPARTQLAKVLEDLQAREWPVRWVRADGLHLTLKFFGTVEEAKAVALAEALGEAAEGTGPIPINCTGVGSFPSSRSAKVIWIGLDAPGTLELLQDSVERACAGLGFPIEGRPFRPHVTLGRVSDGRQLPRNAFADLPGTYDIPFLADRLVLFQSQPGKGGSVYSALHTIPLSPCAVV